MGKWNHRVRFQRERSPMRWYNDRIHHSSGYYNPNDGIPIWEKKFCEVIGSVPWPKVVAATSFKYWYDGNVKTWDDSACEETFHNEKQRFWAQFNGLPCDVSLPDPDLYISEVDWNTTIDPELIKELEKAYFAPPDDVVKTRSKRDRDKSLSDVNPWEEPAGETSKLPLFVGDKVNVINEMGKESNGWDLSESSIDHIKERICLSNRLETEKSRENGIQGNDGWGNSEHQNKKAKGFEGVSAKEYTVHDNPWVGKPSCENEKANDAGWRGSSGNGWEDSVWGSGGGWGNQNCGNQFREMKEWRGKGYSHGIQEQKGYNAWKDDNGANAGSWHARRMSETKPRNWDVKRSSDGWGRQSNERDGLYGNRSNYNFSRPRRDDHQNRKVKW